MFWGSVTGRLLCSFDGVMFPWFFMLLEVLCFCFHIRSSSYLLQFLPSALSNASKFIYFFFAPTMCYNFFCWKSGLPKRLSCLRQCFSGTLKPWSHFTGHCKDQDLYAWVGRLLQVPWHMVLDCTAFTKAFLSMDGWMPNCWWWCGSGGTWMKDILFSMILLYNFNFNLNSHIKLVTTIV